MGQEECGTCSGHGYVVPEGAGCEPCESTGIRTENVALTVRIPPCDDGDFIKFFGQGKSVQFNKQTKGDVYVRVNLKPTESEKGWRKDVLCFLVAYRRVMI